MGTTQQGDTFGKKRTENSHSQNAHHLREHFTISNNNKHQKFESYQS